MYLWSGCLSCACRASSAADDFYDSIVEVEIRSCSAFCILQVVTFFIYSELNGNYALVVQWQATCKPRSRVETRYPRHTSFLISGKAS